MSHSTKKTGAIPMTRKIIVALGAALLATSAFAQMPPQDHHQWPDAEGPRFEQKLSPEQKVKFEAEWMKTWTLRAQFHRDQAQFDDAMKNHDKKTVESLRAKLDADMAALHAERHLRDDIRGSNEMHGPHPHPHMPDGGPGVGPDGGPHGEFGPHDGAAPPPGAGGPGMAGGHPPVDQE
jgi:hypothetical protein